MDWLYIYQYNLSIYHQQQLLSHRP